MLKCEGMEVVRSWADVWRDEDTSRSASTSSARQTGTELADHTNKRVKRVPVECRCVACDKVFFKKVDQIREGRKNCCSIKCRGVAHAKPFPALTEKDCPSCGHTHTKPGIFCSRTCANSRGKRSEDFKSKVKAAFASRLEHERLVKEQCSKTPGKSICKVCLQVLDLDAFQTRMLKGQRTRTHICRPCFKIRRIPSDQETREIIRARIEGGDFSEMAKAVRKDCRHNDRVHGRAFNLTHEFVLSAIQQPCLYCGEDELRRSLDRVDNDIGHLMSNVVPACLRCNLTRSNMPHEAWLVVAPGMRKAREMGLFRTWEGKRRLINRLKPKKYPKANSKNSKE